MHHSPPMITTSKPFFSWLTVTTRFIPSTPCSTSCEPTVTWECENEVKFTSFTQHKKHSESPAPIVAVKEGDECWTHYCDVRMEYKDCQRDAFGSLCGKCVCRRCVEEESEDKRVNGISHEE